MSRISTEAAPHSWDLEHWPLHVYPHSQNRARYLLRAFRDELIAAGALTRIGREIVVLGARYSRWLEKRSADVPEYKCAANATRAGTDEPARG